MANLALDSIFNCDIVDLGGVNPSFAGVWTPASEVGQVPKGVTVQFTDNARTYHQKYFNTAYTDWLLTNAFKHIALPAQRPLILDVGSGSGATVFSLLSAFADADILATDISPNLLSILRMLLTEKDVGQNVMTMCLDLNREWFDGQPFDIVIGKAILHHLFNPALLVSQVYHALKPGGSLIFFEPFEPGNAMLALVLRQILDSKPADNGLTPHMRAFLIRRIRVAEIMKCEGKPVETYADIDDKIAFTRSYFQTIANQLGAGLTIYPVNNVQHPFRENLMTQFRMALGCGPEIMPKWAWEIVARAEASVSLNCKIDCLTSGCIILTKPSGLPSSG